MLRNILFGGRQLARTPQALTSAQQQQNRGNAGGPPGKLECFVDGKKVLVDPGTTVLQVMKKSRQTTVSCLFTFYNFNHDNFTIILGRCYGRCRNSQILLP